MALFDDGKLASVFEASMSTAAGRMETFPGVGLGVSRECLHIRNEIQSVRDQIDLAIGDILDHCSPSPPIPELGEPDPQPWDPAQCDRAWNRLRALTEHLEALKDREKRVCPPRLA